MHLFKRPSQHGCRFRAVLCERRHKLCSAQSIPVTWQTQGLPCAAASGHASSKTLR
jgi:hypothetical protein